MQDAPRAGLPPMPKFEDAPRAGLSRKPKLQDALGASHNHNLTHPAILKVMIFFAVS